MPGNIKEAFLKLDHFYFSYEKDNINYIFLFTYEYNINVPTLILRFMMIFQKHIEQRKSKREIKRKINSFIDMIQQTLENNYQQQIVDTLILKILFKFQLTHRVFIKNVLNLGEDLIIQNEDLFSFKRFYFRFI
ncbi:unnamed protein product [Paramecium sonneborni]|uniref:Uncharacterized protein n=1 Tax=Paramecium sonneborni TaxID=65129 RepID=A0A8S1NS90_9CILI|nr:unnamed protein product [Paramecium sonneborni]